jgi:hypothetical protein
MIIGMIQARWTSVKPMWQFQDKLPRFPLPKLEDTLQRYTEGTLSSFFIKIHIYPIIDTF